VGQALRLRSGQGQFLTKIKQTLKRWWIGIRWGTWEDAKRFMGTPWPYWVFTIAWLSLWIPGKLYFYTEMMSWFWIIYLGLLGPMIFALCWIFDALLFESPLLLSTILVVLASVFTLLTYAVPSFEIIKDHDVVVGQPASFYWQLNNMNADYVFIVLPRGGKRIRLEPKNMNDIYGNGHFTITFSKGGETALRLIAIDRKNRRMHDEIFVVTPAGPKESEYKNITI